MMTYEENPPGHMTGWEQHILSGERKISGKYSVRELKNIHVEQEWEKDIWL